MIVGLAIGALLAPRGNWGARRRAGAASRAGRRSARWCSPRCGRTTAGTTCRWPRARSAIRAQPAARARAGLARRARDLRARQRRLLPRAAVRRGRDVELDAYPDAPSVAAKVASQFLGGTTQALLACAMALCGAVGDERLDADRRARAVRGRARWPRAARARAAVGRRARAARRGDRAGRVGERARAVRRVRRAHRRGRVRVVAVLRAQRRHRCCCCAAAARSRRGRSACRAFRSCRRVRRASRRCCSSTRSSRRRSSACSASG